jgi:chromosome segregation protein
LYLKKLELYGFKSFANKTTLVFEPGVTAIVGPNGCGKSNISDSIKWVLGEQSAKELRGAKMEDVIFNGTDNTQPVNLAEVSLTFSNKDRIFPIDYDEVIITRRVYRSGESEYLLNKTQVRLKDINTLLAGTGIGVSSYSIAEQGKMDRVLHSRPEDRREIFEEASGITKYKARKKEALNKLENTESNLVRIADIVNEIKRQINSIERQAQKAERFRNEFEKMKALDTKLALREYNAIKEKESDKKSGIISLKKKEGQLSLELSLQQDELRLHRDKINTLDENISSGKQEISRLAADIDKNENSIRINTERIEELKQRCELLSRELDEISKRSAQINQKITDLESGFVIISEEREARLSLIKGTEENLNGITAIIKNCELEITEAKVDIVEKASRESKLRNELSKISSDLNTASSRRRRLGIEEDKIFKDASQVSLDMQAVENSYAEQRKALENVLQLLHCLKNAFTQLTINFKEKTDLIDKLKQRLASSGSRLDVLKDLKQKREGFSDGVKAYMEFIEKEPAQKDLFVGIVADVIQAEESLIKPLEAVLGEMSQAVIVKDIFARQKALEFLKANKSGRAHFIVLNTAGPAENEVPADPDVYEHAGIGLRLSGMIEVKQGCKDVIDRLLEGTYLVEDIGSCPDNTGHWHTLVTRDGDMKRGIVLSGGYDSNDEYTSIIGRDAKIKELSADVDRLRAQIVEYEQEHSRMAFRLEQIKKDVSGQEDIAKREEIKLNSIDAQRVKISEHGQRLQEEIRLIKLELEETVEEEDSLKSREESLGARCGELKAQQDETERLINDNQRLIGEKTSEKENAIMLLAELRTQMSLVNEKYESQNATLNMLKGAIENEKISTAERSAQLEQSRSKSDTLRVDIANLTKTNEDLKIGLEEAGRGLSGVQGERNRLYTLVENSEGKARDMQKDLDELRNAISNCHLNANELSHASASVKERIASAYRIDIEEEGVIFDGAEDFDLMTDELSVLREKIEKMGPVNMVAIEEHKELKERYEFLSAQQQDLINAKESLHKAINKINRTTRKMFIETFEAIKDAFKEYFKLLFGGGTAELFLVDQSDILESGIEIIVRPPGKKLQSISLLSGGEKALTSVALLFALFKVRPTPFCVLDEIDAPLDEANVDRFSRMIEEFIHLTQFIIITHNKKTIAASDVMYGITMERSGISKIISAKLADESQIEQRRRQAETEGVKRLKELAQAPAEEEDTTAAPVTEGTP